VIEATLGRFGRLDVLVNNAGIIIVADVESTTVEQWRKIMAVNAEGVFLGCKHAIPVMRKSGSGSIINLSSAAGLVARRRSRLQCELGAVRILTSPVAAHCREKGDDPLQPIHRAVRHAARGGSRAPHWTRAIEGAGPGRRSLRPAADTLLALYPPRRIALHDRLRARDRRRPHRV
jgi:NAD(P)-dependent dehydrogenase (short-subunit alcohol dehydrogenase family)